MSETIAEMRSRYPWPAAMRRRTAALYLDMSEAGFEREVSAGRLPLPFKLDGKERWLKAAIDEAMDALTGRVSDAHDWEKDQPGLQDDWRWKSKLYENTDPAELERIIRSTRKYRSCP